MKRLLFAVSFTNRENVPSSLGWIGEDKEVKFFGGTETPALVGKKFLLKTFFLILKKTDCLFSPDLLKKRCD